MRMHYVIKSALLAGIASASLTLTGCHAAGDAEMPEAAEQTVYVDLSLSNGLLNAPGYADRAIAKVGDGVLQQQLGDRVRVLAIGSRTVERASDVLSTRSTRKKRLPAVKREVETALHNLLARTRQAGGDGSTNILYTLENSHPACTPHSRINILSDAIEASDAYSVDRALARGEPVRLPPPATAYLRGGCTIEFIGIGISPEMAGGREVQTLPNDKLQALIDGWRAYFVAAGVQPDKVHFTSIL